MSTKKTLFLPVMILRYGWPFSYYWTWLYL